MDKQFLKVSERTNLIGIVADLYEFLEPRDRRVFIQQTAGLGRFLRNLNLAGTPEAVAGDLIGRLEQFGELPDRPAYHALGALLDAILDLGDVGNDDKRSVAELIVRYSLIADEPYLASLKVLYKITAQPVCHPKQEGAGRGSPKFAESPTIDTQLADEAGLERVINSEDNFLDIHLLTGALYCARAVGRVEVPEGSAVGTGFLVGPDLLLTNHHVLPKQEHLEDGVVRFGYYNDASGVPMAGKVVKMKIDFFFTSPAHKLDYSLVRLQEAPLREITAQGDLIGKSIAELAQIGKHRGYLDLVSSEPPKLHRVNILQHPKGDPLKVVMTQNYVDLCAEDRLRYVADTMNGSSGSPVFNQRWQVVAVHHSGAPYPTEDLGSTVKRAWRGRFRVNEGILARAILKDFKERKIDQYLPR
ncbi:MAG: serine protease [Acidobacteriia bacterium]|nr:serine protease [Terriglobia bacterium]